jgi:hypothetical protein
MPVESLRIAVAVGVHRRGEPVTGRRTAVAVQAKDLATKRRDILREVGNRRVAGRGIQQSVRTESQSAAVVNVPRGDVVEQHDTLAQSRVDLSITHDAIDSAAGDRGRVIDVDESILRELRVESESKQPRFAVQIDVVHGQRQLGGAAERDDADAARPFGDEQSAIGRKVQRPRDLETRDDGLDTKTHAVSRRERVTGLRRGGTVTRTGRLHRLGGEHDGQHSCVHGMPHKGRSCHGQWTRASAVDA